MSTQYLRRVSIVLGTAGGPGIDFSDLRCTFTIRRGDYQNPNTLDLRIYNVADATASQIQHEFSQVVVQAGYEGSFGQIFTGTIKQVRKGRTDALDSYVDVTAADGDEAYNFALSAFTLAAGSSVQDSVQGVIGSMVLGGAVQAPASMPALDQNGSVRGRVFYGMARDEMRALARSNDFSWSIQDGRLVLIPLTGYLPGVVPVLSPDTGLIGVPEQTQSGVSMRTLLNPNIKVGQLVKLDSTAVNQLRFGLDSQSVSDNLARAAQIKTNADGFYYAMVVNHQGDTRGQAWHTDLVCLAVDAQVFDFVPTPAVDSLLGVVKPFG